MWSLEAGQDRVARAWHVTIDKAGKVKAWRFTRALIRVAANIPYEQAQAAIDAAESGNSDGRFEAAGIDLVDNALKPLWACWALLAQARGKREPLDMALDRKSVVSGKSVSVRVVPGGPR